MISSEGTRRGRSIDTGPNSQRVKTSKSKTSANQVRANLLNAASLKPRYLRNGRREKKTFGIPEEHSRRSIDWHWSQLPASPNVNIENLDQSDSSRILASSDLIGYDSQVHAQSSINKEHSTGIESFRRGSPEINRL